VPALATPEQWEQVQELSYERPRANTSFPADKLHPKAGRGGFLLSGLCQCLYCAANIHGSTNRRPERQTAWRYYVCSTKEKRPEQCRESKRLPAHRIEHEVVDFVLSRVLTVDFVSKLAERVNAILNNTEVIQDEIERRQKRLGELRRAVSSLLDAIELTPSTDLLERLARRQRERDTCERELKQLQAQMSTNRYLVDETSILNLLTEMRSTLTAGEIKARQLILQGAVVKIELGRDAGRIHYRFPLTRVYLERVNWLELNPVQIYDFEY
jgi:hypothetical protein